MSMRIKQSHVPHRRRRISASVPFFCIVFSFPPGCAQEQAIKRPIPKEIVTRPETGEYTIVYDPGATELPTAVQVVTEVGGVRHLGLLLVPGSKGYARLVPKGFSSDGGASMLRIPWAIEPSGRGWVVREDVFGFVGSVVRRSETEPLTIWVEIDPPGPAGVVPAPETEGSKGQR